MSAERKRADRPKVYELAEELNCRPRDVIAAARELGIAAQNRLTRLTPDAAARIRAHLAANAKPRGEDAT